MPAVTEGGAGIDDDVTCGIGVVGRGHPGRADHELSDARGAEAISLLRHPTVIGRPYRQASDEVRVTLGHRSVRRKRRLVGLESGGERTVAFGNGLRTEFEQGERNHLASHIDRHFRPGEHDVQRSSSAFHFRVHATLNLVAKPEKGDRFAVMMG